MLPSITNNNRHKNINDRRFHSFIGNLEKQRHTCMNNWQLRSTGEEVGRMSDKINKDTKCSEVACFSMTVASFSVESCLNVIP